MSLGWDELIVGLRAGNPEAMRFFCDRYQEALHRLADRRLARRLRARVQPEDIVQSALRTFLRRAEGGEFTLPDSDHLWRLICAITLTKVKKHVRFHHRQKRSVAREVHLGTLEGEDEGSFRFEPVDDTPDPAEQAAFADAFEQLLTSFEEEVRDVIELKLQHCTNVEVAARLGCSERTVRRMLKRVQARLEEVQG